MNIAFAEIIYTLVQKLRGESVFKSLEQLEKSQWYSVEKLKEIQWQKIKKIIDHAYNNVPYYRQKFDEYGITPCKIKDLNDLKHIPILTKEELRENSYTLIARDRKYHFSRDSTSGSSGPATIVYTDRNAAAFQHAVVLRAYRWMGLDIGDKLVRFWGTQLDYKRNLKDRIKDFMLNRMTFSTHFLDKHSMFRYYKQFKRFRPKAIYGFTSAICEFAKFLMENELLTDNINIKVIIVTGEALFSYQRKLMENVFKCDVYNEYGCAEFGPIAYECPEGNMHIMAENLLIEFVKDSKPSPPDSLGEVVVTELNNYAMPLIRYKLGDVGSWTTDTCECGRGLPILKEIEGRSIDFVMTPDGRAIHGMFFDYLPKYFANEINQFQVIQENIDRLLIRYIKGPHFSQKTLSRFESKLKGIVGKHVMVRYHAVKTIPVEKSGKRRFVISKISHKLTDNSNL